MLVSLPSRTRLEFGSIGGNFPYPNKKFTIPFFTISKLMIRNTLKWREEYKPEEITAEEIESEALPGKVSSQIFGLFLADALIDVL